MKFLTSTLLVILLLFGCHSSQTNTRMEMLFSCPDKTQQEIFDELKRRILPTGYSVETEEDRIGFIRFTRKDETGTASGLFVWEFTIENNVIIARSYQQLGSAKLYESDNSSRKYHWKFWEVRDKLNNLCSSDSVKLRPIDNN